MKDLKDKQLALNGSKLGTLAVMATGGGAYKYYDRIKERLGVDVMREDEMECLIIGGCALRQLCAPEIGGRS
jgi:type II pantothenate kinase